MNSQDLAALDTEYLPTISPAKGVYTALAASAVIYAALSGVALLAGGAIG